LNLLFLRFIMADVVEMDVNERGEVSTAKIPVGEVSQYNDSNLSSTTIKLQNDLSRLKIEIVQAKAKMAASKREIDNNDEGDLYSKHNAEVSEELDKLTKERTQTFLNFSNLQVAIKAAQANQAMTKALDLEKGGNIVLEKEEEEYVRELLEEQKELSDQIVKLQQTGVDQEVAIIKARAELAKLYCRNQDLVQRAIEIRRQKETNIDVEDARLQNDLRSGDYKINQLRFMIQKFMIKHKKLGLQFESERNAYFKDLFLRCGRTPEQLRELVVTPVEGDLNEVTPPSATDLDA